MITYSKYNIKETDRFDPDVFVKVKEELDVLFIAIENMAAENKENIIISFFKNHSLKVDWANSNIALTKMLVEGNTGTSQIEALFESGKSNLPFIHSFEEYIRSNIS